MKILDKIKQVLSHKENKEEVKLLEPHTFVSIKDKLYIEFDLEKVVNENLEKKHQDIVDLLIQNLKSKKQGYVKINPKLPDMEEIIFYSQNTFELMIQNSDKSFVNQKEIEEKEVKSILEHKLLNI